MPNFHIHWLSQDSQKGLQKGVKNQVSRFFLMFGSISHFYGCMCKVVGTTKHFIKYDRSIYDQKVDWKECSITETSVSFLNTSCSPYNSYYVVYLEPFGYL